MRVRLEGQSAAAIVMDVTNGDLLGCTSAPSFDPNLFVRGISSRDYGALRDSEFRPLSDKTVQGAYPRDHDQDVERTGRAGNGLMDPEETVACNGYVEISGRRFHCWKRGGHGRVNMVARAARVLRRLLLRGRAAHRHRRHLRDERRLGLGQEVRPSAVRHGAWQQPSRAWKQERYGQDWLIGDTINASIGQGFTLASPIQLATMTRATGVGDRRSAASGAAVWRAGPRQS